MPDPLEVYNDFSFGASGNQNSLASPFILLAQRLLRRCANSASCERLWSVFGATLTELRNRLGVDTLTALSELKMHVRDEHLQKGTKSRMKRKFAERSKAHASGGTSATPDASRHSEGPPATFNFDTHTPDTGATSETASSDRFRDVVADHTRNAEEEDLEYESIRDPEVLTHPLKLVELFDFKTTHWSKIYENTARRSFNEELEMYELLDLDADGEENADVDVDEMTSEIMVG